MANQVLESPTNPHFFQPLLPGFGSYLDIPVKFFSVYLGGRNEGNKVELRSDASARSWKVEMEGRKLTDGWKKFATAHDLRVGDIIVLRHEGALVFHVSCFGPSCCEIQYVQSCDDDDDLDDDHENITNLSMKRSLKTEPESSVDEDNKYNMGKLPSKQHVKKRILEAKAKSFSSDPYRFVALVSDSNLREDTRFLPREFYTSGSLTKGSNKIVLMDEGGKTWTLSLKFRESTGTFYMMRGWRSFCHENELKPGDTVAFKLESKNMKTPPLLRFSTAELKSVSTKDCNKGKSNKSGDSSQTFPSSSSSVSEGRFVTLTATPYSLENGRLHLPNNFITVNRLKNLGRKKITLLDKHGVERPVNLVMEKGNTQMRLGFGLKEFFKANGTKANESLVFELVWKEKTTLPILQFCSNT